MDCPSARQPLYGADKVRHSMPCMGASSLSRRSS
jgi:hypothetical protein